MAFSRDNQRVFISDYDGDIATIKWQAGANSKADFDFTDNIFETGKSGTWSICLTKDEKYLLVGSRKKLSLLETASGEVTKIKLAGNVMAVCLINNDKKAIIAFMNGDLSSIDLETLETTEIAKNVTNDKDLNRILVI